MSENRTNSEIRPITGLRAIAILSVLFYHIDHSLIERGFLGVDLFFVISGFVVANSVLRRSSPPSVLQFYYARLRRIFPPLAVMLALSLAAGYVFLLPDPFVDTARQAFATVLLHANYYFYLNTNYFTDAAASRLLLHTWSLSVEEQFYLLFPIILFVRKRWAILLGAAAVFGFSLFYTYNLLIAGENQLAFYSIGTRCWQFSLGIIGAVVFSTPFMERVTKWPVALPAQAASLSVLLFCLFVPTAFEHNLKIQIALSLAALVLLIFSTARSIINSCLAWLPFRYFGLISYSLYLYHWPVVVLLKSLIDEAVPFGIAVVTLSAGLATLSFYLVEEPFRRSATFRIDHWPRLVTTAASAAIVLLISTQVITRTDGLPSRLPESVKMAQQAKIMTPEFRECYDPKGTDYKVSVLAFAREDKLCRMGPPEQRAGGDLDFILIGDSHAYAMASAVQSAALATGKRGILAAYAGCPALSGLTHGMAADLKCAEFFDAAAALVRKHHIKTVLLISRWSVYLFGGLPSGLDAKTPAVLQIAAHYNDPIRPFHAFDVGLKSTAELFKDLDVVFVLPVPQQRIDVPAVAVPNFMFRRSIDRFFVPASISRERRQKIEDHLKPFISENFRILDPSKKLCDENVCRATNGRTVLYYDDDHLSTAGAKLFEPDFEDILGGLSNAHPHSASR
jgi:peptidoglycan/LPS O-acetylase OafA/YrhL